MVSRAHSTMRKGRRPAKGQTPSERADAQRTVAVHTAQITRGLDVAVPYAVSRGGAAGAVGSLKLGLVPVLNVPVCFALDVEHLAIAMKVSIMITSFWQAH